MKKSFRVHDPVFNGKLWVHFGDPKELSVRFAIPLDDCQGALIEQGKFWHCWIGHIKRWPPNAYQAGTIVHELSHAAWEMAAERGMPTDTEVHSYYLDFLVRETMRNVSQMLKSEE